MPLFYKIICYWIRFLHLLMCIYSCFIYCNKSFVIWDICYSKFKLMSKFFDFYVFFHKVSWIPRINTKEKPSFDEGFQLSTSMNYHKYLWFNVLLNKNMIENVVNKTLKMNILMDNFQCLCSYLMNKIKNEWKVVESFVSSA